MCTSHCVQSAVVNIFIFTVLVVVVASAVTGARLACASSVARPLPANIYSHAACTSAGIPWYTGTPSAGWPGPAACGEIKPFGCLLVAGGWPGCPAPPLRPAIIINNVATTIHSYTATQCTVSQSPKGMVVKIFYHTKIFLTSLVF